jgi:hypothetical protein
MNRLTRRQPPKLTDQNGDPIGNAVEVVMFRADALDIDALPSPLPHSIERSRRRQPRANRWGDKRGAAQVSTDARQSDPQRKCPAMRHVPLSR